MICIKDFVSDTLFIKYIVHFLSEISLNIRSTSTNGIFCKECKFLFSKQLLPTYIHLNDLIIWLCVYEDLNVTVVNDYEVFASKGWMQTCSNSTLSLVNFAITTCLWQTHVVSKNLQKKYFCLLHVLISLILANDDNARYIS